MHRFCLMVIALLVGAAVSSAVAQPVTPGIVSSPCPPRDPAAEAGLKPIDDLFMTPAASPEAFWAEFATLQATVLAADAERNRVQQAADWPSVSLGLRGMPYARQIAIILRGPWSERGDSFDQPETC